MISAGLLLRLVAGITPAIFGRNFSSFDSYADWGWPLVSFGAAGWVVVTVFTPRWPARLKRSIPGVSLKQRKNIARAHGAEAGELTEAPPGETVGELSEAETPGAVTLARAEKRKS